MYLDWVLPFIAVVLILILLYWIVSMSKPLSESFIAAVPIQEYTIPDIRGISGRYVRIRPSLTNGDGFLTISQIQVLDSNDTNVALNKIVTATSVGGNPVDQKYGKNVDYGGVYEFEQGVSGAASVIVDGVTVPRWGLTNVFETSIANDARKDDQYLEIDLSGNVIIKTIIYSGRGDPQEVVFETANGTFDSLQQVSRLTNMRMEVYDANRKKIFEQTFTPDPATNIATIEITTPIVTINIGAGSGSDKCLYPLSNTVTIPNVAAYKAISNAYKTNKKDIITPNLQLIKAVNNLYPNAEPLFDISGRLFSALVDSYPIDFYNKIHAPGQWKVPLSANVSATKLGIPFTKTPIPPLDIPELSIHIFGCISQAAKTEMTDSIMICKNIFLGSPESIENYIALKYSEITTFQPPNIYRATTAGYYDTTGEWNIKGKWCMPDLIQTFTDGEFSTVVSSKNVNWNYGTPPQCNTPLTPSNLALIPFAARNFIVEWVNNRAIRYLHKKTPSVDAASIKLIKVVPTAPSIDITKAALMNTIAQQFYEILGGQVTMTYIYDALPLGTTMIDIRFELVIHSDDTTSYAPIQALKAQYNAISSANSLTQDILDQAAIDYQNNINKLEADDIENTSPPIQGAVARIFYTNTNNIFTITGMILDKNAVTSFVPELNCGMIVPLGPSDGNINYKPTIEYTLNKPKETLTCVPGDIKRVMADYVNMAQNDKNILLKASQPIDTSKGNLFVTKVTGCVPISPTQLALTWNEILYDPVTNIQLNLVPTAATNYVANTCGYTYVTRNGIISYKVDTENWYSPNFIFDASGFKLYDSTTIPACTFDTEVYRKSVGNRFPTGTAGSTLTNDFLQSAFKDGIGVVCPQTIPAYKFSSADYFAANPLIPGGVTAALSHFKTTGITQGLTLKTATTIPAITTISYTKPMPYKTNLTNASGVCPTTSCEDLDVLFSLVDQYNSNPSFPGSILRVTHAFTPNTQQCDIKAEINYDAMIQDIIGQDSIDAVTGIPSITYPMIKKGTVTYDVVNRKTVEGSKSMTLSGIQTVRMALYVQLDKSNCTYQLADASGVDSGVSIQDNTPALYKPMDYVEQLRVQGGTELGSSIGKIQSDFTSVGSSAKAALTKYRANTYTAVGDINTLTVCNATCSDTAVKDKIKAYYNSQPGGLQMTNILYTGSLDGKSCDATFSTNSNQTYGARFSIGTGCTVTGSTPILPTPTYSDIQNISVPLSTANTYKGSVSGFADYKEEVAAAEDVYPLTAEGFGLDRARNSTDSYTDIQFEQPLDQNLPVKEIPERTTYKFLRFVPLETRGASAVGLGKITFYREGSPVKIEGKVTNPMGTWEGSLKDVTGRGFRAGWRDNHKKPLVFAFKAPMVLDAYSITTSARESLDADPISWRFEGSSNGTFWTVLDTQQRYPTSVDRFRESDIFDF